MKSIKKYGIGLTLALALVFGIGSSAAQAQTVSSSSSLTSAQISSIVGLLEVFGADQSVVSQVQAILNGTTPTTPTSPTASATVQAGSNSAVTSPTPTTGFVWTSSDPANPNSIQGQLQAQGETWTETSAPITVGSYVEDTLEGRLNQPEGRGAIGKVLYTAVGTNGEPAAMVDFGNGYQVGIYFSELSSVTITGASTPTADSVTAVNNAGNSATAQGLIWVYWPTLGPGYTYTVSASPSYPGSVETTSSVNSGGQSGVNMGCWAGGSVCYNGGGAFPTNGPYTFTVTATSPSGVTTTVGTSNPESPEINSNPVSAPSTSPAIVSITSSVSVGGTVTITGNGFNANSLVLVNGPATQLNLSPSSVYSTWLTFTLPSNIPAGGYTAQIEEAQKGYAPVSNTVNFTVTSSSSNQSSITITSPTANQTFAEGQDMHISWTGGTYPVEVGVVNANFPSSPNVVGWIQARANANGDIDWDTTHIGPIDYLTSGQSSVIQPGQYKILVVSQSPSGYYCYGQISWATGCIYDVSNTFTLTTTSNQTPSSFTVTSPTANSVLQVGQTYNITWTGTDTANPTNLPEQVYLVGGALGNTGNLSIANNIPVTTQSYSWTVPSTVQPGTNYQVGVGANVKGGSGGQSQPFTISSPVQTSPVGGTVTAINHVQNSATAPGLVYVYWPSQGSGYTYTVTASPSYPGNNVTTTATGVNMGCTGTYCYNSTSAFPTNGPYTFTVTATSANGTITVGTSNPETVSSPSTTSSNQPSITITSPAVGAVLTAGSRYTFTSSAPSALTNVVITMKNSAGQTVKSVNAQIVAAQSTFAWTIPSTWPTGVYTIYATSNGSPVIISNAAFKVIGSSISSQQQSAVYAAIQALIAALKAQ